jgi:hypothetical protein
MRVPAGWEERTNMLSFVDEFVTDGAPMEIDCRHHVTLAQRDELEARGYVVLPGSGPRGARSDPRGPGGGVRSPSAVTSFLCALVCFISLLKV